MAGAFGSATGYVPALAQNATLKLESEKEKAEAETQRIKKIQDEQKKQIEKLEAEKKKITDGFIEKL